MPREQGGRLYHLEGRLGRAFGAPRRKPAHRGVAGPQDTQLIYGSAQRSPPRSSSLGFQEDLGALYALLCLGFHRPRQIWIREGRADGWGAWGGATGCTWLNLRLLPSW